MPLSTSTGQPNTSSFSNYILVYACTAFFLPPFFRQTRTMLREEGWPKGFIRKVPLYLSVFSTGHNRLFRLPLVAAKKISFAVVQRLGKGMPAVSGAETWAFKNTMLAVQVR